MTSVIDEAHAFPRLTGTICTVCGRNARLAGHNVVQIIPGPTVFAKCLRVVKWDPSSLRSAYSECRRAHHQNGLERPLRVPDWPVCETIG
jgi:hypothetical protein